MVTVNVSSQYWVVNPKGVREKLDIGVGQEFQILPCGDRIEFFPHKNIESMKGSLEGIDTKIIREEDRR